MAIITKPTIAKGQANEIDLSKSDLAAVSKVVNDSYFSDQANWSKVILQYESSEGGQQEIVVFDASEASPKGNFEVSEKARDSWEIKAVVIMDFDGGYLDLVRGDLTVEEFDIALGSVGGDIGTAIQWESKLNYVPEADGGLISTNTDSNPSGIIYTSTPIDTSSDFEIVYNVDGSMVNFNFLGYSNSSKSSWSGLYIDGNERLLVNNGAYTYNNIRVVNSVKIQKVGSDLYFTVNDVLLYQTTSDQLDSFIYPAVRILNGSITVTSSSISL